MIASKPARSSDWCQMKSTGGSITDAIAWQASSSQFDPGNCTTPNFIARLPAAILTHRNSPEAPRALPCTTLLFLTLGLLGSYAAFENRAGSQFKAKEL